MNIFSKKNKDKRTSFALKKNGRPPLPENSISIFMDDPTNNRPMISAPVLQSHNSDISNLVNVQRFAQNTQNHQEHLHPIQGHFQYNYETNDNDTLNLSQGVPKRKPPPKSPSEYDMPDLRRKDSIQRRQSLKHVDKVNKTLPSVPPRLQEAEEEPSDYNTMHRNGPAVNTSAYEQLVASSDPLPQQSQFFPESGKEYLQNLEIPMRSTRRQTQFLSSAPGTAIQTSDPPPKSLKRLSKFMPFSNETQNKDAFKRASSFDVVSARKVTDDLTPDKVFRKSSLDTDLIHAFNKNLYSEYNNESQRSDFNPYGLNIDSSTKAPRQELVSPISEEMNTETTQLAAPVQKAAVRPKSAQNMPVHLETPKKNHELLHKNLSAVNFKSPFTTVDDDDDDSVSSKSKISEFQKNIMISRDNEKEYLENPTHAHPPVESAEDTVFYPPIDNTPMESLLQDLWAPVQKMNLLEEETHMREIESFLAVQKVSQINEKPEETADYESIFSEKVDMDKTVVAAEEPEIFEKSSHSVQKLPEVPQYMGPTISAAVNKSNVNYQIDDSVLEFGESFDLDAIVAEVDAIENKKQLRDHLERKATVNLNAVIRKYKEANRYNEAANIHKELAYLSTLSHKSSIKHSLQHESEEEILDIDLKKYLLINQYLNRKNTVKFDTKSSIIINTPPESEWSQFESPSYFNSTAHEPVVRSDFGAIKESESENSSIGGASENIDICKENSGDIDPIPHTSQSILDTLSPISPLAPFKHDELESDEEVLGFHNQFGSEKRDQYDTYEEHFEDNYIESDDTDVENTVNIEKQESPVSELFNKGQFQSIDGAHGALLSPQSPQSPLSPLSPLSPGSMVSSSNYSLPDSKSFLSSGNDEVIRVKPLLNNTATAREPPRDNGRMSSLNSTAERMAKQKQAMKESKRDLKRDTTMSTNSDFGPNRAVSMFSAGSVVDTVAESVSRYDVDSDSDETINITAFTASTLTSYHFRQCKAVWSLREVFLWLNSISSWFAGQLIKKRELGLAIENLIRYKFPKLKMEKYVECVTSMIREFEVNGCLINSFENDGSVTFNTAASHKLNGVYTLFTECYSTSYNSHESRDYGCYTLSCPHEKSKAFTVPTKPVENPNDFKPSWDMYWDIDQSELATYDNKTIALQGQTYDLIKKESSFIGDLEFFVYTVGSDFMSNPNMDMIVYPDNKEVLYQCIFGTVKPVLECHKTHLMEPMKKIMQEQGKFIKSGLWSLYRPWAKKAYPLYLRYIDLLAHTILFRDIEKLKKHSDFLEWLDEFASHSSVLNRMFSNHVVYTLIQDKESLNSIRKLHKNTRGQDLDDLMEAISILSEFCDRVNHRFGVAETSTLIRTFSWKISHTNFNIRIDSRVMSLVVKFVVNRKVAMGRWSSTNHYLILFDNCLFLTEIDFDNRKFLVTSKPIAINLALQRLTNDAESENDSMMLTAETDSKAIDYVKISHLGQDSSWQIRFSKSSERKFLIEKLSFHKAEQAKKMMKAHPIKLNAVITDLSANFCDGAILNSSPANLPITDAINLYNSNSVSHAQMKKVLSCAVFLEQGVKYYLVGTAAGLYIRNDKVPWFKLGRVKEVPQLLYVEEARLVLALCDKKFVQFNTEDLCKAMSGAPIVQPTKLSGESVDFFGGGYIQNSYMIFYMKVKVASSATPYRSFKTLVLDSKKRAFKSNTVFQKFFMALDCLGCTTFRNSVILRTERGFQMLDSALKPLNLPQIVKVGSNNTSKEAHFFNVLEHRTMVCKPIASFSIHGDKEILIVFSEFAVFCNERGFLSRMKLLEFNIKVKHAFMSGNKLFVMCKNVIEVYEIPASEEGKIYTSYSFVSDGFEPINEFGPNDSFFFTVPCAQKAAKAVLEFVR